MLKQSDFKQILTRVPQWAGRDDIQTFLLDGGITNENVRVDVAGESFVLRLAGAKTELLGIDRQQEHLAQAAAAQIGVAPEVVCFIEPEGYLVTRFVNGRSPSPIEMKQSDMIQHVAALLKRVHALPPISATFSAFRVVEQYTAVAKQHGVTFPPQFAEWLARVGEIETAVNKTPFTLALCHNDLLNGNFLMGNGRVWLLDWEYAGMGDIYFDLANFAAHHEFGDEQESRLLKDYFGTVTPSQQARLKLMKIMSDFREAMWGMVQVGISQLDFDFRAYADQHFDRVVANLYHSKFRQWLREIGD